jgi:GT2 family glycosyltransferase
MISASIVAYKNDPLELCNVLSCLLLGNVELIYVVDNSPTDALRKFVIDKSEKIVYYFGHGNIGFGAGHNIALRKLIDNYSSIYHLVLNADVYFDPEVIDILRNKLDLNPNIGLIMPKVFNGDGSLQFLPKLLPSPFHLLIRVFGPLKFFFSAIYNMYVLKSYADYEINVPVISGCFSLFRMEALRNVGVYDEKFFMYFEDFDLSRRFQNRYSTVYDPSTSIVHLHERGAAKSYRLFKIYMSSAIIYFGKYGWFFDSEREIINNRVLIQLGAFE